MNRNELEGFGILITVILIIQIAILVEPSSAADISIPASFSSSQDESQYRHHFPISISQPEDLIGFGFEGSGTQEDPFVIENLNITVTTGNCIAIVDVSEYVVIRNCFLRSSSYFYASIYLTNVNFSRIENCIVEARGHGIETYNTNGTVIQNCIVYGASHGLHLGYSREIEVSESRIFLNSYGIQIDGSAECNISSNSVYANSNIGIHVGSVSYDNLISRNQIGWNGPNDQSENDARDNGNGNEWESNQWSNYIAPGPHPIDGTAASTDTSPQLLQDSEYPVIEPMEDIFFADGTTGVELQWSFTDEFPERYELILHNEFTIDGLCIFNQITVPLDGIPPGDYQFTLRIYDASGRRSEDSAYVTVYVIMFSDIGSPMLTYASVSSAVAVIAVLVLFKIRQRS